MSKVKVAIVGAGILGSRHARVFHEQIDSEVVAVIDTNQARAQDVATKIGTKAFSSLTEALEICNPDALAVATPDHLHRDSVLTALNHGLHVFLEKPLATTAKDAEAIIQAAEASDAVVMINFSQRFVPDYVWIKDAIDQGKIGKPIMVNSQKFDTLYVPTEMIAWAAKTSPTFFMSSHDFDLVNWYLKVSPIEVVAHESRGVLEAKGIDIHDGINILVQYEGGISTSFHSSWIHPNTYPIIADGNLQIIGSEGMLTLNNRTRRAELYNSKGGQELVFAGPHTANEVNGKIVGAFTDSVRHFLACIFEKREPDTSPRKTLHTIYTQLAAVESLRSKKTISLLSQG